MGITILVLYALFIVVWRATRGGPEAEKLSPS